MINVFQDNVRGFWLTKSLFPDWNGWYDRNADDYVFPVFVATLVYLIFELAFNARLLDAVGGQATMDEINRIELFGRGISGIALALALVGGVIIPFYIRRGLEDHKSFMVIVCVVTVLSMFGMYKFQEKLVDYIVESSTAEERHAAVRLRMLTDAVHDGKVMIDNIDLDSEVLLSPEGKSFMALLPVMAFSIDDLNERTDASMRHVIRNLVIKDVGDPVSLYNGIYAPAVEDLYERYVEYAEGSNKYSDAIAQIPAKQAEGWQLYLRRLKAFGYTPSSVPRSLDHRFRYEVRKLGVDVPDNWRADDQRGLYAAIERQIREEADERYRREMRRIPQFRHSYPPPGLSLNDFALFPSIQETLIEEMGVARYGIRLLPDYSYEEYRDLVWEKIVSWHVAEKMEMVNSSLTQFGDGGAYEEEGRLAMKALAVPPIALFFSLIGGLVHLYKASNLGLRLVWPEARWRTPLVAAVSLALLSFPLSQGNAITDSGLFSSFEEITSERFGPLGSGSLTWIVKAQPYAYPVNSFLREYPLFGFSFGYADKVGQDWNLGGDSNPLGLDRKRG